MKTMFIKSKLAKLVLSLAVLATTSIAAEQMGEYSVNLAVNDTLGTYLVNQTGFTLYHFTQDATGNLTSSCYGKCAEIWPPFYVENLKVAEGLSSTDFKEFDRTDGRKQIAYKGWPLYFYFKDTDPKDVYGQGFNKVWFVVNITTPNNSQPITQLPSTPTQSSAQGYGSSGGY
jgi:predicted lipoprotein with Yx(FWY)xxD motif